MHRYLIVMLAALCTMIIFTACGTADSVVTSSIATSGSEVTASIEEEQDIQDKTLEQAGTEKTDEEVEVTESREGNFRVGFWGDTAETVKQYETAEFLGESEGNLLYSAEVAGWSAYACYFFDAEEKFYQGVYQFTETYNRGTTYINRYNVLKESLMAKYGEPWFDKVENLSDLAQYTDEGTALELGYTFYASRWTVDNTEITLALTNQTGTIMTVIEYRDTNHEEVHDTEGL